MLFVLSCISMLYACRGGYSFTGASILPSNKTFCVQQAVNRARIVNATLAPDITLALNNKISSSTSLVSVDADADIVFKETITGYNVTPVAIGGNDKAAKNRLTVTINVTCTNKQDKKMNFTQSFTRYKDYDSSLSLNDVQETLVAQIKEEIVEDIFNKAFVNW